MKYLLIIPLIIANTAVFSLNSEFDYPSDYAIMAHRFVDKMDDIAAPLTRSRDGYTHAPRWGINLPNQAQSESLLKQQNYWMQPQDPYAWSQPHTRTNHDFPSHQWLPAPTQGVAALEAYLTVLDGSWQGVNRDMLIIRGDKFRIYLNAKQFRDGYLSVKGNQLTMIIPNEASPKTFEFAEFNGYLLLKNEQGVIIRYQLVSKH